MGRQHEKIEPKPKKRKTKYSQGSSTKEASTVSLVLKSLPSLAWTNVPRTISQVPNFFRRRIFGSRWEGPEQPFAGFTQKNSCAHEYTRERKVFSWSLSSGKHERCLAIKADKNQNHVSDSCRIDRDEGQRQHEVIRTFYSMKIDFAYELFQHIRWCQFVFSFISRLSINIIWRCFFNDLITW